MKIFLIGYMGSGKTTIGKKMAKVMKYRFLDLDEYIESHYNNSITNIFKEEGESGFRMKEEEMLKKVIDIDEKLVVSTGGGAPCFHNNINKINSAGISVYLKAPVGVIVNRLVNAKTQRPIVANKTNEELHDFISKHLEERAFFYDQAKLTVDCMGYGSKEIEELVDKINYCK